MEFDFSSRIDRKGSGATALTRIPIPDAAVDEGFEPIPMWIADMNFAAVPCVREALHRRIDHPCFGYFVTPDAYYDAVIRWQKHRNGVTELPREAIGYENGVLGGVVSALQAFSAPGDPVLVHAPTYIGFTGVLTNNGRRIVLSELRQDEAGVWRMDYEDMERKLREEKIHVAVLCSPHNPCGRVWERWELERAMELYRKYDCVVISDEIWSDIILPGHKHIPTQSVSADARHRTVALYSVSKTFSLAGLVGSYHIIYDRYLRERVEKQSSLCHYNDANLLSVESLIAAYCDEGERWVNELNAVLDGNVRRAWEFFTARGFRAALPEGTYMLYLDASDYLARRGESLDELLRRGVKYGVIWQDGRPFNRPDAIRLNVALPAAVLEEALSRLEKYVL